MSDSLEFRAAGIHEGCEEVSGVVGVRTTRETFFEGLRSRRPDVRAKRISCSDSAYSRRLVRKSPGRQTKNRRCSDSWKARHIRNKTQEDFRHAKGGPLTAPTGKKSMEALRLPFLFV